MPKAIVLLSGGLDSATVVAIAKRNGDEIFPLSFDYGQRHSLELKAVKKVAEYYQVSHVHKVIKLDFSGIVSSLTGHGEVPTTTATSDAIPSTYVPARNTIFIAYALGYAESIGAEKIYLGAHALDYSGYPDCRPEYFEQYQKLIDLATKAGVEGGQISLATPLLNMTKSEIITTGLDLGVDYSITSSCYNPQDERACGECHSCQIRLRAFAELGLEDPIPYI